MQKTSEGFGLGFEIGEAGGFVMNESAAAQMLFSWSQVDKELLQARSGLALLRCSANKSLAIEPGLRWHYIPATFCESHPNKCCDETSHPFCLTFIWFIGHCHLSILKCFCFISLRDVHILHTALLYNYSI